MHSPIGLCLHAVVNGLNRRRGQFARLILLQHLKVRMGQAMLGRQNRSLRRGRNALVRGTTRRRRPAELHEPGLQRQPEG